jgi:membrane-bound metal-dependent hydrolase YbcI (DUF457 family)
VFLRNTRGDLYIEYHRRVGYSFLFAIPLMLALGAFATNRKKTMAAGLLIFSVHLFADAMGSIDANWGVYPFYPLSNISFLGLPWFSDDFCYYIMGPITPPMAQ